MTDDHARLTHTRTPDPRPAPLLAVAIGEQHLVWAISAAVTDDVAEEIQRVLAGGAAGRAVALGWRPRTTRLLLDLLGEQAAPSQRIAREPGFRPPGDWWWISPHPTAL